MQMTEALISRTDGFTKYIKKHLCKKTIQIKKDIKETEQICFSILQIGLCTYTNFNAVLKTLTSTG